VSRDRRALNNGGFTNPARLTKQTQSNEKKLFKIITISRSNNKIKPCLANKICKNFTGFAKLCKKATSGVVSDGFEFGLALEFYGQKPTKMLDTF
jgi:hypothetical protein